MIILQNQNPESCNLITENVLVLLLYVLTSCHSRKPIAVLDSGYLASEDLPMTEIYSVYMQSLLLHMVSMDGYLYNNYFSLEIMKMRILPFYFDMVSKLLLFIDTRLTFLILLSLIIQMEILMLNTCIYCSSGILCNVISSKNISITLSNLYLVAADVYNAVNYYIQSLHFIAKMHVYVKVKSFVLVLIARSYFLHAYHVCCYQFTLYIYDYMACSREIHTCKDQ